MELLLNLSIVILTFIVMEGVAWFYTQICDAWFFMVFAQGSSCAESRESF